MKLDKEIVRVREVISIEDNILFLIKGELDLSKTLY
jgi:hypothetical protein